MPASARVRTHAPRTTAVPRYHRRVSGPVRPRPVPAGAAIGAAGAAVRGRQRTSAFERLRALPEHRVVDSLLRSRAWIVVVAVMLGGIVAMQVSLLKLNNGISRAVQTSATLERQNADMEDSIARLSSGDRIQAAALRSGMVSPPAGEIGFLQSRPGRDDAVAAQRMTPPSADAKAVMANGGREVNAVATTTTTTTATPPPSTPTGSGTTSTAPSATTTSAAATTSTAATAPSPTVTPSATPYPPAASATSATTPQG
jgi:cell division protein FtsB